MGNIVATIDGYVNCITQSTNENATILEIITPHIASKIYQIKEVCLFRNNPNYVDIMKSLELNKPFTFVVKYGWVIPQLLDLNQPKMHVKNIKIVDFLDLSKQYPKLNGWHEIIYDDNLGSKLITKDIGVFEKNKEYEVHFMLYGVDYFYQIKEYKKMNYE